MEDWSGTENLMDRGSGLIGYQEAAGRCFVGVSEIAVRQQSVSQE